MTDLTERSVIVTGGASRMGAEGAVLAGRYGARVTVADLSFEGGQRTTDRIRADGGEAHFIRTDIAEDAHVRSMVESAVDTYGGLHGVMQGIGSMPCCRASSATR